MLNRIDIRGVHLVLDDSLKRYIKNKITKLEKFITPNIQASVHVEVYAKELRSQGYKQSECEVIFHMPKENIRVKEATVNMYAAVDIVEEKLRLSLIKYKDLHDNPKRDRKLFRKTLLQSR